MSDAVTTQNAPQTTETAAPANREEFLALLEQMDGADEQTAKQVEADQYEADINAKLEVEPDNETAIATDKGEDTPKAEGEQKKPDEPPAIDLKAEREKLDRERAEFEQRKAAFDAQAAKAKQDLESAEKQAADLERYAKEWDETGEHDLAKTAREKAATIRQSAQAARQESEKAAFRIKQEAVIREVVQMHPELSKPDSQMTKEMDALLRSRPFLLSYPEGIRDAAAFLTARGAMQQTQALQKENADLKAQLDALQKRLRPATSKGTPSAPRGQSSFDQLSKDQQRAQLLNAARKADAGA